MNAGLPEFAVVLRRPRIMVAVLAIACATSGVAGEPSRSGIATSEVPQSTWIWREVLREKLKSEPPVQLEPKPVLELSPILLHAAPDTDLVRLPPYQVNGARMEAALKRQYAAQEKRAREDAVLRRTGTGVHAIHSGRFSAGVVTVFYVPVFASAGWSW